MAPDTNTTWQLRAVIEGSPSLVEASSGRQTRECGLPSTSCKAVTDPPRIEKMNQNTVASLLELATKSVLSNQSTGIRALELLPKHLFLPLFVTALKERQKKMLTEIVKRWPFQCLHIGSLNIEDSPLEIFEALVDGLQIVSDENISSGGPQLQVLDLRENMDCELTCYYRASSPFCLSSCVYAHNAIPNAEESQNRDRGLEMGALESEHASSRRIIELIVNISFRRGFRMNQFLYFLKRKIRQSSGNLHLCCRKVYIRNMCSHTRRLRFLNPACINCLEVNRVHLRKVTRLFPQLICLDKLILTARPFQYCEGRSFRIFVEWLGKMAILRDLSLSSFYLGGHLEELLSVLLSPLDSLSLRFCNLSTVDVTVLSESSQLTHITRLNLSDNNLFKESYYPFRMLLRRASRTLQHLEIRNCKLTDAILSALLSELSCCSELCVFCFSSNPISMSALKGFLQRVAACLKLQEVIYPIPVHCYGDNSYILNYERLSEVQYQVKLMLQVVKREDMYWSTSTV
ncbi:melanoma antigen preferentially expressed in tumors-like [Suncus etruscus]|uniref:melanoma antigen preferentially expressed in tumors-like n=1 Tax=Suncus etruscus TaxID=109475 RepID=UPI00210F2A6D|nr:melanoma antigen preferentially expressed in tumors-like [Suncus etruscus]